MNCLCLKAKEFRFIFFSEMSSPCGSEVWGVVSGVGHDEGEAVLPKVVGVVIGVGVEMGGADVEWRGW